MSIAGHATGDGPLAGIAAEMGIDAREIAARKLFLELGSTDAEQLKALDVRLATAQNGFADGFYDYLRAIPELQALLPDEGAVRRLRTAHNRYFASLIGGDYDEDYVVRRLQVGMTHARIGLTPKWYVGAFRKYLSDMLQVVWQASDGDFSRFSPAFDALLKVVMLDLGLTLDTYIHADKHAIALRDQAIDSSNNGIFIATNAPECTLVYVNRAFSRMLDRDREASAGDPCPCTDGEDCFGSIRKAIAEGRDGLVNLQRQRPDGSMQWIELFLAPVSDDSGRTTHYVGILDDITARKESEAHLDYLVRHDPLTGLPNRVLFRERFSLATAMAERKGGRIALLFVDLDHFKTINDTLGHPVGDRLLQDVAKRLRDCVRDTDTISRLGGDEFLIALTDVVDPDDAGRVAAKIVEALAQPFDIEAHELAATLSLGIALWPDDGTDFDILLQRADTAMYQAKGAGRNTYRFFTAEMNAEAMEQLQLRAALRRALENGEFELHYQPQIELKSQRVTGVEALLRWRRDGELVPPGRFIPVAEESGLIVPIGDWVLREACRQAARWQQAGLPELAMAVNLSAVQFQRGDLERCVAEALAESGLDPVLLELELTESLLLDDAEGVLAAARRFKALGVRLSIDDFGTGYSSLAYLKRFDVDKLKIDQSFVRDIASDPDDAAIVRAIISMARSLKLRVIAEGVETDDVARFLDIYHCDEAQGFLYARPMPGEAIPQWLASWRAGGADDY